MHYGALRAERATASSPIYGKAILSRSSSAVPGEEVPFQEPWQAELFAITHKLAHAGLFVWTQWAERFSNALADAKARGGPADGSDYYEVWLATLESLLIERGAASAGELSRIRAAWVEAYQRTPHGEPVELDEIRLDAD